MPGRSKARRRWTSGGAETTTTASHRQSAPVSNKKRHIEHDDAGAAGLRLGKEFFPRSEDQRMDDGLEPGERRVVVQHHRGELGAVDLAVGGRAWKRRSINGTASPS